jgi:hypothetical protein
VAFFRSLAIAVTAAAIALGPVPGIALAEDPVAALSRRIDAGATRLPFEGRYGYLPALLEALNVPFESQMAVFSKTSIQSLHIEPANPRVLYFNDSVAVGWVRGGFIELAAQDPGNGIRYYILQQRPDERLTRREDCLRCHSSGTMLLRSVTASPDGVPTGGETDVDNRTPFSGLWGGWFVSGTSVPAGHRGNAVFANGERRTLAPVLDPKFSLAPSSDVVALMVFAHQSRMMNLLAHPDNLRELVDCLLFADEAPLPGPIRGDSAFAEKFASIGPRDRLGRGLRQFDLQRRLMRYPCSYMIYSDAFDALASETKDAIYRRMWNILSGRADAEPGSRYTRLSSADRKAIVEILRDTMKTLPPWFGNG